MGVDLREAAAQRLSFDTAVIKPRYVWKITVNWDTYVKPMRCSNLLIHNLNLQSKTQIYFLSSGWWYWTLVMIVGTKLIHHESSERALISKWNHGMIYQGIALVFDKTSFYKTHDIVWIVYLPT